MNFYPIPLMVSLYAGYKLGRTAGFLAGVVISAFWTVAALVDGAAVPAGRLLWGTVGTDFGFPGMKFFGLSLQGTLLAGLLGYAGGWLFDRLETLLERAGTSLDFLIPLKNRSLLACIIRLPLRWLGGDVRSDGDGRGEPRRRGVAGKVKIASVVLPLTFLNFYFIYYFDFLEIRFPPPYISSLLVLLCAYHFGSRIGMRIALAVWLLCVFLIVYALSMKIEMGFSRYFRMFLSIQSPAQAAGVAILSWWIGKLGELVRDEKRSGPLKKWAAACWRPQIALTPPGYQLIFILLGVAFGVGIAGEGVTVVYYPTLAVFFIVIRLSLPGASHLVSNRVLVTLVFFTVFHLHLPLAYLAVDSLPIDLCDLIVLGALPFFAANIDLSTMRSCRRFAYGILIAMVLPDIFIRGHYTPLFSVFSFKAFSYRIYPATWAVTLFAFECLSRILYRRVGWWAAS
jgi:hypothetical protein